MSFLWFVLVILAVPAARGEFSPTIESDGKGGLILSVLDGLPITASTIGFTSYTYLIFHISLTRVVAVVVLLLLLLLLLCGVQQ